MAGERSGIITAGGRRLLREGLALLLGRQGASVVADSSSLASVPALVQSLQAEVLLLVMGQSNELELLRQLRLEAPGLRIVVLIPTAELEQVRELLAAGVSGILTTDCASDDLVQCINAAREGRTYVGPGIRKLLVLTFLAPRHSDPAGLTPREHQVLKHISEGATTRQIAEKLAIGVKTAETHRRRIMQKLGRNSIAELTRYALSSGMID